MLCDVHPNGEARQLCDGNLRLCRRNSLEKREPVPPGEIAKIRIDMWATGVRVFKGHRLSLVRSRPPRSPRLLRTPTRSTIPAVRSAWWSRHNRVYHEEDHPSRLLLPVVEKLQAVSRKP